MFGVISVSGFGDVRTGADLPVSIDPSRVAASVAAGVGFLGAGAILKLGVSVTGLTTAASLWVTAAVGLASGLGFWAAAIPAALIALASLALLKPVRRAVSLLNRDGSSLLVVDVDHGARVGEVLDVLRQGIHLRSVEVLTGTGTGRARLRFRGGTGRLLEILERAQAHPDVEQAVMFEA